MPDDHVAAHEAISKAREHLVAAVTLDLGRLAMEGDIEDADSRLGAASDWLRDGDVAEARREVSEAIELLRTSQSDFIAKDWNELDAAIRVLEAVGWD
jgi:hypothetical protein